MLCNQQFRVVCLGKFSLEPIHMLSLLMDFQNRLQTLSSFDFVPASFVFVFVFFPFIHVFFFFCLILKNNFQEISEKPISIDFLKIINQLDIKNFKISIDVEKNSKITVRSKRSERKKHSKTFKSKSLIPNHCNEQFNLDCFIHLVFFFFSVEFFFSSKTIFKNIQLNINYQLIQYLWIYVKICKLLFSRATFQNSKIFFFFPFRQKNIWNCKTYFFFKLSEKEHPTILFESRYWNRLNFPAIIIFCLKKLCLHEIVWKRKI